MAVREGVAADRESRVPVRDGSRNECRRGMGARGAVLRSVFRHNDDASNMSPADIRIGIPASMGRRPEAHVFPFPCRASDRDFPFLPRSELNFFDSFNPLEIYVYIRASKNSRDLITVQEEIARESSIDSKVVGEARAEILTQICYAYWICGMSFSRSRARFTLSNIRKCYSISVLIHLCPLFSPRNDTISRRY